MFELKFNFSTSSVSSELKSATMVTPLVTSRAFDIKVTLVGAGWGHSSGWAADRGKQIDPGAT